MLRFRNLRSERLREDEERQDIAAWVGSRRETGVTGGAAREMPIHALRGPFRTKNEAPISFEFVTSFVCSSLELLLVGEGGLEPPRPEGHWHLKPARLPFRHSPEQRRKQ